MVMNKALLSSPELNPLEQVISSTSQSYGNYTLNHLKENRKHEYLPCYTQLLFSHFASDHRVVMLFMNLSCFMFIYMGKTYSRFVFFFFLQSASMYL